MNYRSKFPGERLGVLAIRDFRRFYVGYSASLLGTAMSSVAIAFAVLGERRDADRSRRRVRREHRPDDRVHPRRRRARRPARPPAGDAGRRRGQVRWRRAAWPSRCRSGIRGCGCSSPPRLSSAPATRSSSPPSPACRSQLAPRDRLGDVNALLAVAQPAAQIAGPALAGILIAATSPAAAVAADAASYAVSAIALAMLRFPARAGRPSGPRSRSLLRDLAEGWAEFAARDWIWVPTVQFALFNLLTWGPYLVLGPVLARDYLGGARAWGAILACYGGGAILGGLLALGRRPRRPAGGRQPGHARLPAAAARAGPAPAGRRGGGGGPARRARLGARQRARGDRGRSSGCRRGCCPASGAFNMVGAFAFGPVAFVAAGPVAAAVSAPAPCSGSARPGPPSARSPSSPCPPSAACPGQATMSPPRARNREPPEHVASRAPATGCRRSVHGRRPGGRRGRRSR